MNDVWFRDFAFINDVLHKFYLIIFMNNLNKKFGHKNIKHYGTFLLIMYIYANLSILMNSLTIVIWSNFDQK